MMKFPLLICREVRLIYADPQFFDGIGELDVDRNRLEIGVKSNGTAGLEWILDSEGFFYELCSEGLLPATFLQSVGLHRRRECYRIGDRERVSVGNLNKLLIGVGEAFEEAPLVAELRSLLSSYDTEHILDSEDMRKYHRD